MGTESKSCFFRGLLVLLIGVSVVRCGADNSSNSDANLEIPGSWSYSCLEFSEGEQTELQSHSFAFGSDTFKEILRVFAADDSDCKTPIETRTVTGSYKYERNESTQINAGTIDFVLKSVQMKVASSDLVDYFNGKAGSGNSDPICGGDWEKDKAKDLTASRCKGNKLNLPYADLELFDVYEIKSKELFFGDRKSGLPDKVTERPGSINYERGYARN